MHMRVHLRGAYAFQFGWQEPRGNAAIAESAKGKGVQFDMMQKVRRSADVTADVTAGAASLVCQCLPRAAHRRIRPHECSL